MLRGSSGISSQNLRVLVRDSIPQEIYVKRYQIFSDYLQKERTRGAADERRKRSHGAGRRWAGGASGRG